MYMYEWKEEGGRRHEEMKGRDRRLSSLFQKFTTHLNSMASSRLILNWSLTGVCPGVMYPGQKTHKKSNFDTPDSKRPHKNYNVHVHVTYSY